MKCALHILALNERHSAVATLAGISLCAGCLHRVAIFLEAGGAPSFLMRDALNGRLP